MKVLKFGGTSVGSAQNIKKVIDILQKESLSNPLVCVVSAVGGITDKLLEAGALAKQKDKKYKTVFDKIKTIHYKVIEELTPDSTTIKKEVDTKFEDLEQLLNGIFLINELSPKTSDKLVSFGELLSSFIIAKTMENMGLNTIIKNSQELIVTNSNFTKAEVIYDVTNKNIIDYFNQATQQVTILPGFVSKSHLGEITTLGRGGSDFTAAIIAAALKVEQLEIWTDVSGMYTTNPKLVKQAYPINNLSYQEAMELSHFGAKVLYPPTVQPVLNLAIPIHIKNTLHPEANGTVISNQNNGSDLTVKGISHIDKVALFTLEGSGMVGIPGFSKRLFETLASEKINIIFITQASSEHSICFGIDEGNAETAELAINNTFENEISLHKINPIIVEKGLSIIALIGDNMKSHQGISGKLFSTLGKNNINVRAIAQGASEKNISAVINNNDVSKALNSLHERFFEVNTKQLNVFITGIGNVGEKLIDQIHQQHNFLKKNLKLDVKIVGMANSRKMIFNPKGIDLNNWASQFHHADKSSIEGFYQKVIELNLRNSIFVDVTADKDVAAVYENYLKQSVAVVACNKIACSDKYANYKNLQDLSLKYNASFLYETNVGAGLPIINTLNNLVASGDKVISIQAVLSGSLNFVFNNFSDKKNFHDTVKQAQFEGYTEPDPRIDLSGIDVARKILILARENGIPMEIEDIVNDSFLTKSNLESTSVDNFYDTLIEEEPHFQKLYADAKANNCQLKYVAEYKNGKAKVGLQQIPEGHPFYNLEGKDNIVMFYTQRYPEQPLIVKGAGAGADVTASGLFADIIRIANK
ncbi:bifunctional aspartate kinase/homoserine dehydrogenase I [Olleya aquimaris]|uniref:Bifunctional aspartate kinase/homoserine dehydrogenase I n=1 Tax=Olleya sediminilitoris TaxID=2795739 RepID=A0ABS1WPN4_9FLAO|nr:bifunctional aspartate kinase/homoserine dehydrogenase I [Olleya sediminilitoris]AXO78986.1 bifunctional aspartate kinase/homoserine dehydrogenase I [Olleya aquimaris]MBL7561089.1 bifunctional aspartate kinase/homoserine dehydrogenase I [Olleya sediminilitoris]